MRNLSVAIVVLAAGVAVPASLMAPALSHADAAAHAPAAQTLTPQDRGFVDSFIMTGLAVIEAGTLASRRASSEELRRLGNKLALDHRSTNRQLATLLAPMQLAPLPDAPDAEHKAIADRLAQPAAGHFDRLFLETQQRDHRDLITLLQAQQRSGDRSALREFAAAILPTVRGNLQRLTALEAEILRREDCADCLQNVPLHPAPPGASGT